MADNNIVRHNIKDIEVDYYPVTETDLEYLSERTKSSDISKFFTSIFLSGLLTIILTIRLNPDIPEGTMDDLVLLKWIFVVVTTASLFFTFRLYRLSRKTISKLLQKSPKKYSSKIMEEKSNPPHFIGNRLITMNLDVRKKEHFLNAFQNNEKYALLSTTNHPNTGKTDFFTFTVQNGNENLFTDLKEFLKDYGIKNEDYRYVN